jgi:hypothetical protein
METDVATALALLKASGKAITADAVREIVALPTSIDVPTLTSAPIDLAAYDGLLLGEVAA